MAKAKLTKQLAVETSNKIGMFVEVTGAIADAGANIISICAYGDNNKALFYLIASNNKKAKIALLKKGFKVTEKEVITIALKDKVGQAKEIAEKIKEAGISLDYVYGTTCGCKDKGALIVIGTKDKNKLVSVLNS